MPNNSTDSELELTIRYFRYEVHRLMNDRKGQFDEAGKAILEAKIILPLPITRMVGSHRKYGIGRAQVSNEHLSGYFAQLYNAGGAIHALDAVLSLLEYTRTDEYRRQHPLPDGF